MHRTLTLALPTGVGGAQSDGRESAMPAADWAKSAFRPQAHPTAIATSSTEGDDTTSDRRFDTDGDGALCLNEVPRYDASDVHAAVP